MYPPAPWVLQGHVLALAYLIDKDVASEWVPSEFEIVSVLPGKTVAGVYAAAYGCGSTLTYNELIIVPALVRFGERIGAWISHIYVDHPVSVAGGQAIWGLPKTLAEFDWDEGEAGVKLRVRQHGRELCRLRARRRFGVWTPPARFYFLSVRSGEVMRTTVHARANAELAKAHIEVSDDSPFAGLGFGGTRLAVVMQPTTATVYAPQRLGPLEEE